MGTGLSGRAQVKVKAEPKGVVHIDVNEAIQLKKREAEAVLQKKREAAAEKERKLEEAAVRWALNVITVAIIQMLGTQCFCNGL